MLVQQKGFQVDEASPYFNLKSCLPKTRSGSTVAEQAELEEICKIS